MTHGVKLVAALAAWMAAVVIVELGFANCSSPECNRYYVQAKFTFGPHLDWCKEYVGEETAARMMYSKMSIGGKADTVKTVDYTAWAGPCPPECPGVVLEGIHAVPTPEGKKTEDLTEEVNTRCNNGT